MTPTPRPARYRSHLATALAAIILIGLASRMGGGRFPTLIAKDLGDVLWSLMFFTIALLLWHRSPAWLPATLAMAAASASELLKLYHAPWIEALRVGRVGGLLLGHTFHPTNFLAYALGAAAGVAIDRLLFRRARLPHRPA